MPLNLGNLFGGSAPRYVGALQPPAARTGPAAGLLTGLYELFGYQPPRYVTDPIDNPNDDRPPVQ